MFKFCEHVEYNIYNYGSVYVYYNYRSVYIQIYCINYGSLFITNMLIKISLIYCIRLRVLIFKIFIQIMNNTVTISSIHFMSYLVRSYIVR